MLDSLQSQLATFGRTFNSLRCLVARSHGKMCTSAINNTRVVLDFCQLSNRPSLKLVKKIVRELGVKTETLLALRYNNYRNAAVLEFADSSVAATFVNKPLIYQENKIPVYLENNAKEVFIHDLPLGMDNTDIAQVMCKYGDVLSIANDRWKNFFPGLPNGVRILRMLVNQPVPRSITVRDHIAIVIYKGQKPLCKLNAKKIGKKSNGKVNKNHNESQKNNENNTSNKCTSNRKSSNVSVNVNNNSDPKISSQDEQSTSIDQEQSTSKDEEINVFQNNTNVNRDEQQIENEHQEEKERAECNNNNTKTTKNHEQPIVETSSSSSSSNNNNNNYSDVKINDQSTSMDQEDEINEEEFQLVRSKKDRKRLKRAHSTEHEGKLQNLHPDPEALAGLSKQKRMEAAEKLLSEVTKKQDFYFQKWMEAKHDGSGDLLKEEEFKEKFLKYLSMRNEIIDKRIEDTFNGDNDSDNE